MNRPELKNDISELLDTDFTCRLVQDNDEDIIKALNCIYSHYKYDYLHQALYDIDYFKDVIKSGRFIAAVAENKHGQIAGFGSDDAHPWFPGLMEMGGLIVHPIARGKGIGDMLDDFRIEAGRKKDIRGLFSTPIMPNPASQKLLSRHGFIATGMYFHAGGPDSLGASGDGVHPMDCGFGVYIYDKESLHRIHAPEALKGFLKDVMDTVGINYVFAEPEATAHSETKIYFNHEVPSKLLETRIDGIGPDFRDVIEALPYHDEDDTDIQAIMMLISLNDPCCPALYEYLRSVGFIFAGSVPGGSEDLIVMEHLKHPIYRDYMMIQPDYEAILDKVLEINGL